mmetsp:Transcript_51063/g.142881  ORF Transcript_51063/g.142881 Transcript_51063/m.142881 type:complete len:206 (+) Transcript_51063:353-970(+)
MLRLRRRCSFESEIDAPEVRIFSWLRRGGGRCSFGPDIDALNVGALRRLRRGGEHGCHSDGHASIRGTSWRRCGRLSGRGQSLRRAFGGANGAEGRLVGRQCRRRRGRPAVATPAEEVCRPGPGTLQLGNGPEYVLHHGLVFHSAVRWLPAEPIVVRRWPRLAQLPWRCELCKRGCTLGHVLIAPARRRCRRRRRERGAGVLRIQ